MKRSNEESAGHSHQNKKHKHDHSQRKHSQHHHSGSKQHKHDMKHNQDRRELQKASYEDALKQLPPATSTSTPVPTYTHFTVPADQLPPLPSIQDEALSTAPFKHKSTVSYNRSTSSADMTYERLEFLGDAYIELIASRLIFSRFPALPAGQQSQLRELLVKNETLAEYSRAYGFDKRVQVGSMDAMIEEAKQKGNKGFNKVLGDVFEAYIAAVALADIEDGFAVIEKWLTALWAPKLLEAVKNDRSHAQNTITHDGGTADPRKIYNPSAKADLQKRIMGPGVKLAYDKYKDSIELKGDQLGQNLHFIALYLTGYGHERKLLGKGEGRNKVEAGNWAATEAMHGEAKGLVEECERENTRMKEEKRAKREREEAGQS